MTITDLRYFLDPIMLALQHAELTHTYRPQVNIIGISGGAGWRPWPQLSTLAWHGRLRWPAFSPCTCCPSFPIRMYWVLHQEVDYLDLFLLAAQNRVYVQVFNEFDNACLLVQLTTPMRTFCPP